jgi:hypothetical protein
MPDFLHKPITWMITAAVVIGAVRWLTGALTSGKRAKVEAQLGKEQIGAAIGSGQDAVDTLGQQRASDTAIDRKVNDAKQAIDAATDAASADAAGRDGLCGISGSLCRQHPLQQPGTR